MAKVLDSMTKKSLKFETEVWSQIWMANEIDGYCNARWSLIRNNTSLNFYVSLNFDKNDKIQSKIQCQSPRICNGSTYFFPLFSLSNSENWKSFKVYKKYGGVWILTVGRKSMKWLWMRSVANLLYYHWPPADFTQIYVVQNLCMTSCAFNFFLCIIRFC